MSNSINGGLNAAVNTAAAASTSNNVNKPKEGEKKPENKQIGGVFTKEQLEFLDKLDSLKKTDRLTKNQDLGKDQFMHILLKQLANQNPLDPMQDKDFVAQMAQFSTLENMQSMSAGISGLSSNVEAIKSLLGKPGEKDGDLIKTIGLMAEKLDSINKLMSEQKAKDVYKKD